MSYAIMRTKKLKGAGSIGGSISHAYRERETPNADIDRTKENEVIVEYDKEKCRNDIEHARTRPDNVEVIEILMTTSPEWMENATPEQKEQWKNESMEWLKEEFGEENIQSAILHKDEKTDHITAQVTPIKDGRLNAGYWLEGKKRCRDLQERYWQKVKDLGLERGERGSKAKHQEVQAYYGRIEKAQSIVAQEKAEREKSYTMPSPPSGIMFSKDEMRKYGQQVARDVLGQAMQREYTLVAKNQELEAKLKANRGNISKNRTLEQMIADQKPWVNFAQQVDELRKINPSIQTELNRGMTMHRNIWEGEIKKLTPEEITKRMLKERDPERRKFMTEVRSAIRQAQKTRTHSRSKGNDGIEL